MSKERPPHGEFSEKERAARAFTNGINRLFARHIDAVETHYPLDTLQVQSLNLVARLPEGGEREITLSRQRSRTSDVVTGHTMIILSRGRTDATTPEVSDEYYIEESKVKHRTVSTELDMTAFFAPEKEITIENLTTAIDNAKLKEDDSVPLTEIQRVIDLAESAELAPVTFEALVDAHSKKAQEDPPNEYERMLARDGFIRAVDEELLANDSKVIIEPTPNEDGERETYYTDDKVHHFGMAVGKTTADTGEVVHHVIASRLGRLSTTRLLIYTVAEGVVSHLSRDDEAISDAVVGTHLLNRIQRFMQDPRTQD